MFFPFLAMCLAASMIAAPPGHATDDPYEAVDGLYVGHVIGRPAERVTIELRGSSLVILDPKAIGIMSTSRWELAGPGGKGGDLQWATAATSRGTASRAGKMKPPGRRFSSTVRLRLWPGERTAVLCATDPRVKDPVIRRVPAPGATEAPDLGVACYDLVRVWSPHDTQLPVVPEPAAPDFECMRECRQQNMARAVGAEVIEEDCRRACTTH